MFEPQRIVRLMTTVLLMAFHQLGSMHIHADEVATNKDVTVTEAAHNVVLVTMDGLRWQELFLGADKRLMNRDAGGVRDADALEKQFWRESPIERREQLMPFFWANVAEQGIVFGNPEEESRAVVTNGLYFSYPGYSELLCGFADPAIDSNAKKNNPNVTVLEWLNLQPSFRGKVAAFCSWDVFPFIINRQRSGVPVNAGWEPMVDVLSPTDHADPELRAARQRLEQLDRVGEQMPHVWQNVRYDYLTFRVAEEYVRLNKPRVLYLSLGETDDWAHEGRYDLYLDAARRNDDYIRQLWTLLQSMPEYQNNTTLIITTDHGRGDDRVGWKSHGRDVADCNFIWIAVLGPNIQADAEKPPQVTQSQIAATVAAAVGENFRADHAQASAALPVFKQAAGN